MATTNSSSPPSHLPPPPPPSPQLPSFVTPRAWERRRPQIISAPTDLLLDECYRGRAVRIRSLIQSGGADVNARDYYHDHQAPLWIACSLGYYDVAKVLLEHGAQVEVEHEKTGATPLLEACRGGYTNLVRLLLSYGANPNRPNWTTTGETILLASCAEKRWDVVKLLLDFGGVPKEDMQEKTMAQGETALHLIARSLGNNRAKSQDRELLQDLIIRFVNAGVDINARDIRGRTALHVYCGYEDLDETVVEFWVVDCGANVNVECEKGWTPLLQCSSSANYPCSRVLLEHGANVNHVTMDTDEWTPLLLFCSAENYNPEAVRELVVEYQANVKAVRRRDGKTALHFVCEKGDADTARLLLDCGADCNAQTCNDQVTPMHTSIIHNHLAVTRVLLERGRGTLTDLGRKDGMAPLHLASALGYRDQVTVLLSHGALPNAPAAHHGLPPLYFAVENGHLPTVRALLQGGANVNLRCKGRPLLFIAYFKVQNVSSVELVKLLMEMGAQVDAPIHTKHGTTLLQLACWNSGMAPLINRMKSVHKRHVAAHQTGMPNFCSLFLGAGASRSKPNHHGWQALHFAAARGDRSIIQLLLINEPYVRDNKDNEESTTTTTTSSSSKDLINAQTLQGSTPLHIASQMGRSQMVHALLEHGALVTVTNSNGKLPLDAALLGSNKTCIYLILQRMAGEGLV